jgi:dynein heavy chain, axonemal
MIPIDELQFDFGVRPLLNTQIGQPITDDGIFVEGLYLEGCKWNASLRELDESDPKVLFVECPQINLIPSLSKDLSHIQVYDCPVYKTSERRGVLSTTGHSSNFVLWIKLPTSRHDSHWVKRGVALLTQLDD